GLRARRCSWTDSKFCIKCKPTMLDSRQLIDFEVPGHRTRPVATRPRRECIMEEQPADPILDGLPRCVAWLLFVSLAHVLISDLPRRVIQLIDPRVLIPKERIDGPVDRSSPFICSGLDQRLPGPTLPLQLAVRGSP